MADATPSEADAVGHSLATMRIFPENEAEDAALAPDANAALEPDAKIAAVRTRPRIAEPPTPIPPPRIAPRTDIPADKTDAPEPTSDEPTADDDVISLIVPAPAAVRVMRKSSLAVSPPDDPDEDEADRVADEIVRDPAAEALESRRRSGANVQRKSDAPPGELPTASPLVDSVLASDGERLDAPTRHFMESRFGHDFSRVRIHADDSASRTAQEMSAHAYTVGRDIVFAPGRYAPATDDGRHLLAHELTHVVQQSGGSAAPSVQRVAAYDTTEQKKLIEDGIAEKSIGKIKDVEPIAFSLAADSQAIDMVLILLNQGWVGPRDEYAIYNIWNSRGKGVVDLASKYTYIWNLCLDRGVDTLWSIPDLEPVRRDFKQAVAGKARGYLDDNKKTVDAERKRYGVDNMNAPPSVEQGQEREKMLVGAGIVKKANDAIATMDRMLVGYDHVVGTPQDSKTERCAAMFNPAVPPPLPGHVPVPAGDVVLPSWDDTRKNYERAHVLIDHYTRLYPALVALGTDANLDVVAKTGVSSDEAASHLTAMNVISKVLGDTAANIDKTYGLVNDPKSEFPLELQPLHEQFFMLDPAWKDPFRQLIARAAIKEHGNVEFWKTLGVGAVGMAMFVVAELTTGGLATFFFAAAAAGGIAQAAASWDKYFTLDAAAGTNMTKESSLISKDQASDQLLTATIDTVMAFVGAYGAGKSGAEALKAASSEQLLAGIASKEEQQLIAAGAMEANGPKGPLIGPTAGSAAERASLMRQLRTNLRSYWEALTGGAPIKAGECFLATDMNEANTLYEGMLRRDPAREAAIWRSATSGDVVVVQGEGNWVGGSVGAPTATDRWIILEHYHPERNFAVQIPSPADYDTLLWGHGGRGTGAIQGRIESTIRYMDPKTGQWHFSHFGYDPHLENSALGPFFANIETKGGARVDLSFRDMNELTNMAGRLKAGEEIPR